MKRLIFDDEHEAFRETCRRYFEREVAPNAEKWLADGLVECLLVVALVEEAALVLEYSGLDEQDVGDGQWGDFHRSMLALFVEDGELSEKPVAALEYLLVEYPNQILAVAIFEQWLGKGFALI